MFIKQANLKNFGVVSEASFNFTEGITVFSGNNGEGKSTFLKAIAMLNYNHYALTLKDYIKWGEESFTISCIFMHNNKEYENFLTYSEKKGSSRILKCGSEEYYNSDALAKLDSILDFKRAISATISFEGEVDLINTTPSERREYLKSIYDLSFKSQLATIENDITTSKSEIQRLNGELVSLEGQTFYYAEMLPLPFDENKYKDLEKDAEILSGKIALIQAKLTEQNKIREEMRKLESDILGGERSVENQKNKIENLCCAIKTLEEEIANYPKRIDSSHIEVTYRQKLDEFADMVKNVQANLATNEEELKSLESQRDALSYSSNDEFALVKSLSSAESALKSAEKKMKDMESGICPTCGHPYESSEIGLVEAEVNLQKGLIETYTKSLADMREVKHNLESVKTKIDALNREIATLKSNESSYQMRIESQTKMMESDISNYEQRVMLEKKHKEENLSSTKENYLEAVEYLDKLEFTLQELKTRIVPVPETSSLVEEENHLKGEKKSIESYLDSYKNIVATNTERARGNERTKQSERIRDEKKSCVTKTLETEQENLERYTLAKKVLSKEFPSYVLSKMVSELSFYVNEFLSKVYPKFQITIEESKNSLSILYGENKSEVKSASGFEKQVFSFAYKFALGRIQNYGILFLDEVDSSASVENSQKFYETLGKMDSYFKQVFVITHKPEIKDILYNDYQATIYTVEKGEYEVA